MESPEDAQSAVKLALITARFEDEWECVFERLVVLTLQNADEGDDCV
jgi:hypothetical protein